MPRTLNFADGFVTETQPTGGAFTPSNLTLPQYANDAAYEAAKGAAAVTGDLYARTDGQVRVYVDSSWRSVSADTLTETLTNKTISLGIGNIDTTGQVATKSLVTDGVGGVTFGDVGYYTDGLDNACIAASVASNTLTIELKTRDGSTNPSADNYSRIAFRSQTLTSGRNNVRTVSSSLSMTVSNGSTLGNISGQLWPVYVYAIDNAGTPELAVSSAWYPDNYLVTTVAEGGAGAADSPTVMYSTTARTNVGVAMLGYILITNAGTWTSAPTQVRSGKMSDYHSNWQTGNGVMTNVSANHEQRWRRVGDTMEIHMGTDIGGTVSAELYFNLPGSWVTDTAKMAFPTFNLAETAILGYAKAYDVSTGNTYIGLIQPGSTTSIFRIRGANGGAFYWDTTTPFVWTSGDGISLKMAVPISGWTA